MPRPQFFYRSKPQTDVRPQGVGRRKFLLTKDAPDYLKAYAFDVEFACLLDGNFPPAAKNTPSSAAVFNSVAGFSLQDTNAILTDFSEPQDLGGGLGKFTGTFNIVPASWDEFTIQAVTFPGIRDNAYTGGARDPVTVNALTRQRRDYFVVDPDGVLTGLNVKDSGGNAITVVGSKGAIPSLPRTPWKFLVAGVITPGGEVTGLVKAGGIIGWLETVPNTGTYLAWVAVAQTFNAALAGGGTQQWDATHPPVWDGAASPSTAIGQYRFADSRLEDYAGNIVCRVSEYVMAQ